MTLSTSVKRLGPKGFGDPRTSRWRGVAAPFRNKPDGHFGISGTRDVIWSSIMNILLTPIGTRIMLPEFGSRLPELVFDPNDSYIQVAARVEVFEAIRRWEPRVVIRDVDTFRDLYDGHGLYIRMTYEIRTENILEDRTLPISRGG